ncbi:FtsX-like permease family protein [Salisaeta longa]|uniref:FtsX-like permease family protein n=1 Tax=Salisaeta longa TaxID=503170 RepID=UPI0003B64C57|nr:ABC transporter permease [Salisaeta longa]
MTLLQRASFRYLTRHPWLMGLSVLGVALGVAVVVSIDLANTSASRAFRLSAQTVTGKATHQVVGAANDLSGDVYRRLTVQLGLRKAAPVVEGYGALAPSGRTMQVLGVDPFSEAPFRPYVATGAQGIDVGTFITRPTALMAQSTAQALGVQAGDTLRLAVEGVSHRLVVGALLRPKSERTRSAIRNLLVVDISTAQDLFDMPGQLSRIDLIVPKGADGRPTLAAIRSALPPGAQLRPTGTRTSTIAQMTRAFELNLTALSLLALVVGAFLIYNTMTFSVVQRRGLIGRLRALGVTRRQVFGLILGEAALLGLAGTALGLLGGIVLALGLVQLITQTINDLYFVVTVRELSVAPWTLLKGAALGMGTTLAAALPPAREATRATVSTVLQRSAQETSIRMLAPRLAGAGAVVALGATALLLWPTRSIWMGYAGLLGVLAAAALVIPLVVWGLARGVRPLMGRLAGVLGRMAARGVATTLSRTAVAIAALTIAVASTVGVGVMIQSFRGTVVSWLRQALQADVYVQPPSLVFRRSNATLQHDTVHRLKTTAGVASSHTVRRVTVRTRDGQAELVAVAPGPQIEDIYRLKAGDASAIWPAFQGGSFVLASEPYAYKHRVAVGDTVRLQTDRGWRALPVRGIYYDYGSDVGTLLMSRSTYTGLYDDRGISGLALYAADGQSVDALIQRMRARLAGSTQDVIIQSNKTLREASLKIFDRTFTITAVLRLLAVIVAFIGVLTALMALQLERQRELAVLRATGMTPPQVGGYVTLQTGLMGLMAGLLALPLGYLLAYVLVHVINKRSFGWTLQVTVSGEVLLQAVALALVAALLAGAYPAYRMMQVRPATALRED